jgi:hypothetical protein
MSHRLRAWLSAPLPRWQMLLTASASTVGVLLAAFLNAKGWTR